MPALRSFRPAALFRNDSALGALLALFAFAVYLTTLAPSIGFIDAGELATVAATFGIAHPTGYPLFTLAAGAFAKLPLGDSVIWRLNLFAALCCALSVFFFFRFFLELLRMEQDGEKEGRGGVGNALRAAAAIGALTLAFSRTFWQQSTGVEVYSLHLLMVSLVLYFFVRAVQGAPRAWQLFALCLGLSFANHMTTVLLLPGLAWLFFAARGFSRSGQARAWKEITRGLPAFLAGLSLYLYLPLRAAAGPALNWGNPVTFENFWRHVTGKQYAVWMFSSLDSALRQLQTFAGDFPANFGYVALAPMAVGFAVLWKKGRVGRDIAVFTALLFATCVLYAVNYDIHDIATYFLLAEIAASFWIARGALQIAQSAPWIARGTLKSASGILVAAALAAACALPPLALHYRAVDESGNYVVEDYARNLLDSLEANATLITYQWDHFVSAAWYLQRVEGYRTDVTILERELLRRSWYLAQLRRHHPEAVAGSRAEVDAFLSAVRPFERGEPFDGAVIQAAFQAMIRSLLAHASTRGPVYCTPEVEGEYLQGWRGVPNGLAFRLYGNDGDTAAPASIPPAFYIRPFPPLPKDGPEFQVVRASYAMAYVNHAFRQGSTGNLAAVRPLLLHALEIRPGYPQALELMRRLEGGR